MFVFGFGYETDEMMETCELKVERNAHNGLTIVRPSDQTWAIHDPLESRKHWTSSSGVESIHARSKTFRICVKSKSIYF